MEEVMSKRRIKILCTRSPRGLIFHTDHPGLLEMQISDFALATAQDADTYLRMYIKELMFKCGIRLDEIDCARPNTYQAFYELKGEDEKEKLFRIRSREYEAAARRQKMLEEEIRLRKMPEVFEMNMVEALEGWKTWGMGQTKEFLTTRGVAWLPDQALEAKCDASCGEVPRTDHTCGIYASDNRQGAIGYGQVLGQVYGWGRYVRGDSGWKAQYAYPKCFYLIAEQVELIEPLKKYHVPIYIQQPMKIYNPAEEGYDGYWTAEENGDSGADQISAAYQERDPDEDDD